MCPGSGWEQFPQGRWNCSSNGALRGEFSLKHAYDNPESGLDFLAYSHDRLDHSDSCLFSFKIRHGYTPSSANNWQIAFGAEFSRESRQIQKGIVLGVNFMGSDDMVKIWNLVNGEPQLLYATSLNYQEMVGIEHAALFTLVWHPEGELKLFFTEDPFTDEVVEIGSCELELLPNGQQLVIRYAYSSARDRSLWLDDVIYGGKFIRDTLAPFVTGVELECEHTIKISFTEELELHVRNSFLLDGEPPDSMRIDGADVFLDFAYPIPNRIPLRLWIGNVCDRVHNCLTDTVMEIMRNEAEWGDVVINEVMADPDPEVLLSEGEYLELYNRSTYTLDLSHWRLQVNERIYDLNGGFMEAFSYKVIKRSALPNKGAILALYNDQGVLVHGTSYRVPWNGTEWKKEGGWSLESPDPNHLCLVSQSWAYSTDPSGGTPGRINSIFSPKEDVENPVMLYYGYESPESILLTYSEPISIQLINQDDFLLRPGSLFPTEIEIREPLSTQLLLKYPTELQDRLQFSIRIPALRDCQGNLSLSERLTGAQLSPPEEGNLFINEIMYDPQEGKPEFVELYNPGPDYFDLKYLALHVLESGAPPQQPINLSEGSRIFLPGEYLVVCSSVHFLMESYGLRRSGQWLELENLPVLKNTGGTLYLSDRSGRVVDQVTYSDELHMDLLNDSKGISLERISIERPGSEAANWHSAASIVGYATPGEENSQVVNHLFEEKILSVEPEVFSPDNDGYQDLLNIWISPESSGWIIRLWISDLTGALIRSLANNHIAGPSLSYGWDGESDQGRMATEGIYMLHLVLYHPASGERRRKREAIGLIYR